MSWWNLNYKKRIKYTRTLTSGEIAQNQVISLLIAENTGGDIDLQGNGNKFPPNKNDGGDIAIIDNDDITQLSFWIEEVTGASPNRIAKCWVKIPTAYTSGNSFSFYMYFSNSNANNLSNGDNTFSLFDDFEGNSLDLNKWTVLRGSVSQSNSIATISDGSRFESLSLFSPGNMARFKFQGSQITDNAIQEIRFQDKGSFKIRPDNSIILFRKKASSLPNYLFKTKESGSAKTINTFVPVNDNWHTGNLWWVTGTPDNAKCRIDDNPIVQTNKYVPDIDLTFAFMTRSPNYTETLNIDWVFVSPYKENTYISTQGNIENAPYLKRIKLLKMNLTNV